MEYATGETRALAIIRLSFSFFAFPKKKTPIKKVSGVMIAALLLMAHEW